MAWPEIDVALTFARTAERCSAERVAQALGLALTQDRVTRAYSLSTTPGRRAIAGYELCAPRPGPADE
ncbi:MAG: hypothetical protein AAFR46_03810 [Pseudomonadota bacterium]